MTVLVLAVSGAATLAREVELTRSKGTAVEAFAGRERSAARGQAGAERIDGADRVPSEWSGLTSLISGTSLAVRRY